MTADKTFAELLKTARKESGLTNKGFAALCKTSSVNIWRWENGQRTPTIDRAEKILKRLGKTMTIGKG